MNLADRPRRPRDRARGRPAEREELDRHRRDDRTDQSIVHTECIGRDREEAGTDELRALGRQVPDAEVLVPTADGEQRSPFADQVDELAPESFKLARDSLLLPILTAADEQEVGRR